MKILFIDEFTQKRILLLNQHPDPRKVAAELALKLNVETADITGIPFIKDGKVCMTKTSTLSDAIKGRITN